MSDTAIKLHIQQQKKVKEVAAAMETLVNATSTMGYDEFVVEGIVKGLTSCHRTLQQSFMRDFKDAMVKYGDIEYFDLRNQAAVKFAKKVGELEEHLPYI